MTIGTQFPQPDPRGWLVFDQLPDDIQRAEDATTAADIERSRRRWDSYDSPDGITPPWGRRWPPRPDNPGRSPRGVWFARRATPTERQLLTHLGYQLPAELFTLVHYETAVRNRRWPQLETEGAHNND
ncbi:hypothetical protein [Gordonia hongkongensis]|uniref:hypothetical protein n=1 Tax=Gordonia hongkongensis TaxID=1701090 RepID=UPI003D7267E6